MCHIPVTRVTRTPNNHILHNMAETKDRKGIWQAEFWANGKRIRKSTGVAVGATRAEQRASKQLAQQVADNMERVAKGETSYTQAADALRTVAQATGMIAKMPTVRSCAHCLVVFGVNCW